MSASADDEVWSCKVAGLAADALVDAGMIAKQDLDRAAELIALEVKVRLALGDAPKSARLV